MNSTTSGGLLNAVDKVGEDIARSQMFGCKNESQGRVIALSCLTTGRDILSVPEEYYIMNGKLSLQSTAMLGRLVKAGGEYEVVEHSPQRAAIVITYKGRRVVGEITWEEAQGEPFVYAGKQSDVLDNLRSDEGKKKLVLSANYATPRRRMQHLWARVVSDSVRVAAPNLVTGSYTPEEVADFSGLVTPDRSMAGVGSMVAASSGPASSGPANSGPANSGPVTSYDGAATATTRAVSSPAASRPAESTAETTVVDPVSTDEQIAVIKQLVVELEVPEDALAKIYAKRGASGPEGLTESQANELIEFMRGKLQEKLQAKQPSQSAERQSSATNSSTASTAESVATGGATVARLDGPAPDHLIARVREKIKEVAQSSGEGREFADKVKLKLDAFGIKLKDMCYADAEALLHSLEIKNIEEFFMRQLTLPQSQSQPESPPVDDSGNASGESPS